MSRYRLSTARLALVASCAATAALLASAATAAPAHAHAQHVIVISVDGLHQSDVDSYIATHANSTFARLVNEGTSFSNARTPFPSDSFPGLTAIVTGANPKTTGVYYDDSWNRRLLPPNTTDCKGATPGTEVTYFEQLDRNLKSIDAGQGLLDPSNAATYTYDNIAALIPKLSKQARDNIDPAQLPVDPVSCQGVYPHAYLHVNTIFEVAKAHGLHTAWSDKHAAYDLINGPSGAGVDDLFAPEVNSLIPGGSGDDWTKDNLSTQCYDGLKVNAVLNWAKGADHDGTPNRAGAPAIYGMNFQSVSTAQKLNFSHFIGDGGIKGEGGYFADGRTASTVLGGALEFVDVQLGRILAAVNPKNTLVIVSAKHGQSPLDRAQLRLIDDGEVVSAINAAWGATHSEQSLVAFAIDDDGMLLWLADRSAVATGFVRNFLWNYVPVKTGGSDSAGNFVSYDGTVQHSGLRAIYAGEDAAEFIGVSQDDERVPDVIGIAQVGVVYSSPTKIKKIAEHGGDAQQDRHVPILVWGRGVPNLRIADRVETTQIAPTVLQALHLPVDELEGARREHTAALLDLGGRD